MNADATNFGQFVSHIFSMWNMYSLLKSIWASTQFCRTNYYSFLAKLNYLNCSSLPILSCVLHLCNVIGLNFHTENNIYIYRAEPIAFHSLECILNLDFNSLNWIEMKFVIPNDSECIDDNWLNFQLIICSLIDFHSKWWLAFSLPYACYY